MPEYDDTNTLVLFSNDKEGNDKRPDFKGKINVGGKEYSLSVWKNTSAAGKSYLKGKVEEPWNGGEAKKEEAIPF